MLNFFTKRMKNKKGFTLVELIVVVAILGILAAIAVPRFGGFTEKAAIRADEATMSVIANAARIHYADTKPASISISDLITAQLLEGTVDDYKPQQSGKTGFNITIESGGNIKVDYASSGSTD